MKTLEEKQIEGMTTEDLRISMNAWHRAKINNERDLINAYKSYQEKKTTFRKNHLRYCIKDYRLSRELFHIYFTAFCKSITKDELDEKGKKAA